MERDRNHLMGIMNITPDSFSDGGEYNLADTFETRLNTFLNQKAIDIIDIGAESTAPFNSTISADEELKRYESTLLAYLKKTGWNSLKELSLDTQKIVTIKRLVYEIQKLDSSIVIWWNDISGSLDEATLTFLSANPKLKFVLTHNFAQARAVNHIQFVQKISDADLMVQMINFFNEAKTTILKHKIDLNRIYFDPGFGFAKDRAQNLYLMDELPHLIKSVNHSHWLLGLSRKSFLREIGETRSKGVHVIEASELKLTNYLKKLRPKLESIPSISITHRVHSPERYLFLI